MPHPFIAQGGSLQCFGNNENAEGPAGNSADDPGTGSDLADYGRLLLHELVHYLRLQSEPSPPILRLFGKSISLLELA